MEGRKVTSYDIKVALSQMHEGRPTYFITECKTCSTYFPVPQGLLIFDGLAVTKSYTKPCITGYEIKVSRSDFLQDAKWHLYLQYCNEFFFVVPKGLIKKDELPENVGLIYYDPEKETLRTVKKALFRQIEEPVGVYKYIIYSRLEQDRIPFYEDRAEYARSYIEDKSEKRKLGRSFGGKLANDLVEAQMRLAMLEKTEDRLHLLDEFISIMKKHNVGRYCWKDNELPAELDKALQNHYPEGLDDVCKDLQRLVDRMDRIKKDCTTVSEDES